MKSSISQFEQHEKTAENLAENLAPNGAYNLVIVNAAWVLTRAGLGHCEYITAGTNTLWSNPTNDARLSVTPNGEILA